ncbi:MAG: FAD-binding and (Fe-S)-binding domain-containing protein [Dermatophilaceae bacterium]
MTRRDHANRSGRGRDVVPPDPTLRQDLTTRAAYSSDASLYRSLPTAVSEPRSADDIRAALAHARTRGWSVASRGGGTSIAGNAISDGLIIDLSRHQRRVLLIDPQARTARVQPGVVCDDLRAAAAPFGLTYGPDPSTHSRCTIGGMVGNNACGSHSVAWGTTAGNLLEVRLLLADGREVTATSHGCDDPRIESALRSLVARHETEIRAELGRFPRQVSGYGLHHLLPERGFDVAKAIAGSEGTLGVFTELTVALVRAPSAVALAILSYEDIFAAARAAPALRGAGVLTLEAMGHDLIAAYRSTPGRQDAQDVLPPGGAWLLCDVAGDSRQGAAAAARHLVDRAARLTTAPLRHSRIVTEPTAHRAAWRMREEAAGIATRRADGAEAWPGWEDSAVPPERLEDYLRDLYALLERHGLQGIPYGHFGEGCVHIRIDFPLATPTGVAVYDRFIRAAARLVVRHGGSLSGEHGDGRARSELLSTMYSPRLMDAFAQFKAVFDPDGRFNPGVLVDPAPFVAGLRPGPGRDARDRATAHAFAADGGSYTRAVHRCVGVGLCRNDAGAMCPSFQVTHDEVASTRGRARVLAEMLRGEHVDGWRSPEALEALDLCLSCRACATECPVGVDMATLKSEFLHQHFRHRLRPRPHYALGWLPVTGAAISAVPGLGPGIGRLARRRSVERAILRCAGLEERRALIDFATMSLVDWWRERAARGEAPGPGRGPRVVLWPDTFSNRHDPLTGIAAVEVLESLGFEVVMPTRAVCCGLTWHSTGQLGMARRALRRTLDVLEPHLADGTPILGLEPSCTGHLARATDLVPGEARASRLEQLTQGFSAFVAAHQDPWPFPSAPPVSSRPVIVQTHCHEQGLPWHAADRQVLTRLGIDVLEVAEGCCGMAGNWGYEPGHHEVSQACARRALYPTIEAHGGADALVCADGFSCRTQVAQGTGAAARHLAVLLRRALAQGR